MKVRITGNRNGLRWYQRTIGEIYEVTETIDEDGDYYCKDEEGFIAVHDCEVVAEFAIGSKVRITQPRHRLQGKVGVITQYDKDASMFPWRVEVINEDWDVFKDDYMELVDEQWIDKETALKLCIDGAKIVDDTMPHAGSYVYFDGKEFKYYSAILRESGYSDEFMESTKFKLWQPPTPKFTKDTFVVDDDGDYGRIVSMEYKGNSWMYKLSDCVDNDDLWTKAEGDIEVA